MTVPSSGETRVHATVNGPCMALCWCCDVKRAANGAIFSCSSLFLSFFKDLVCGLTSVYWDLSYFAFKVGEYVSSLSWFVVAVWDFELFPSAMKGWRPETVWKFLRLSVQSWMLNEASVEVACNWLSFTKELVVTSPTTKCTKWHWKHV